jgi:hypothetical protein
MLGTAVDYSYKNSMRVSRNEKNLGKDAGVRFGSELGAGISFREADRLSVEVDYTLKDWRKSGLDGVRGLSSTSSAAEFSAWMGHGVSAGIEFTPARNDIRYFLRRCTYRAGVYYEQSYYRVGGKSIDAAGVTLGMTLPVFRGYNGLSLGLEAGQRGFGGRFRSVAHAAASARLERNFPSADATQNARRFAVAHAFASQPL